MQHVAQPVPATWRGGTMITVASSVRLRERAVALYHRITAGDGVLERLKALSPRWLTRIWKARSLTQSASAFERLGEDLLALKLAGVAPEQLRLAAVELEGIVDDASHGTTDERTVLSALRAADETEAAENRAEAQLLCRHDRTLAPAELDALIEAKQRDIAADREAVVQASRLRAQIRSHRLGITVTRGGVA